MLLVLVDSIGTLIWGTKDLVILDRDGGILF